MRLVPVGPGDLTETPSGHVLARPGQVYAIRIMNLAPVRAVVHVEIDGRVMSGRGLVVAAHRMIELARPVHATERGRFTVFPEGREAVFGEDGGRDNPDLGLIRVRYQREEQAPQTVTLPMPWPTTPIVAPPYRLRDGFTGTPPWTAPWTTIVYGTGAAPDGGGAGTLRDALATAAATVRSTVATACGVSTGAAGVLASASAAGVGSNRSRAAQRAPIDPASIEQAAGTGLTGESNQTFVDVAVGALEPNVTEVVLRLVIGRAPHATPAPRPLPGAVPDTPSAASLGCDPTGRPVRPAALP